MKDMVTNGTGNSRYLKTSLASGTTWESALAMLREGTFPIDLNGLNNGGITQLGSAYSKANVLPDDVCALLGLDSTTAEPKDAFGVVANPAELWVWKKTVVTKDPVPEVPGSYTLGSAAITNLARMTSNGYNGYAADILVSKEIKVNLDGSVELVSPTSRQMIVSGSSESYRIDVNSDELLGAGNRYFTPSKDSNLNSSRCTLLIPPGTVYYVAPGTTYMTAERSIGFTSAFNAAQLVIGVPGTPAIPAGTTTTYPVSTNPNAYQEGDDAKPAWYVVGDVETGTFAMATGNVQYSYASSVSVSDDGTVSLVSPSSTTLSADASSRTIALSMRGKYVKATSSLTNCGVPFSSGSVVFLPADAVVSGTVDIDRYQPVTGYPAIPAGTTIECLGKLGDKTRVQVGSYIGTGTYGSSNPNSLTFGFDPMVVFLSRGEPNANESHITVLKGNTSARDAHTGYTIDISWGIKTMSWYNYVDEAKQYNESGIRYLYVAIG